VAKQQDGSAKESVEVLDVTQILARSLVPAAAAVASVAAEPVSSADTTDTAAEGGSET
jgi:hypothetical protein